MAAGEQPEKIQPIMFVFLLTKILRLHNLSRYILRRLDGL